MKGCGKGPVNVRCVLHFHLNRTLAGDLSVNIYLHNNGGKTEEAVVARPHTGLLGAEPRKESFCRRRLPRIQVQFGRR